MKNLKTIALALFVAFGTTLVNAQTKKVDAGKSTINWVGKKITGEHSGTVNLKEGNLIFKGDKLAGGSFTVDMTSMTATDISGDYKAKLDGHLKSEDFFGTEKNPTSTLIFKKIATKSAGIYTITGDLTIKGITNPITFDMTIKGSVGSTKLIIDRTKYGIKYNSKSFFDSIGDKAIYDDFELTVNLQF